MLIIQLVKWNHWGEEMNSQGRFLVQEQLCLIRGRAPAREEQNYIRVVTGNQ